MQSHLLENDRMDDILQFFLLAELVSFTAICLCSVIFVLTYLPQFALCLFLVASHFTSAKIISQTARLRRIRSLLITTCLKIQSPSHELLSIRSVNIGEPTRSTCAYRIWGFITSGFDYLLLVPRLFHDSQVHASSVFRSSWTVLGRHE